MNHIPEAGQELAQDEDTEMKPEDSAESATWRQIEILESGGDLLLRTKRMFRAKNETPPMNRLRKMGT